MDRREFHGAVVGALAASSGAAGAAVAAPRPPNPCDDLPAGAARRLGTTRFWHMEDHVNDGVNCLAFSPDGRTVAALGYQDHTISLWGVPGGELVRRWPADAADRHGELAFSPDGRLLACGSGDGLRLWNPATGQLVRQFHGEQWYVVDGIAFSPNGRHLAAAVYTGFVDVWDVANGERVSRFSVRPPGPVANPVSGIWCATVAFSPDGRTLAAGTGGIHDGGRVWCWEWPSGRPLATRPDGQFGISRVRFRADGRLVACSADGEVWVEDAATAVRVAELAPSLGERFLSEIGFVDGGRHALLSRPDGLIVIELNGGGPVRTFPPVPTGWVPVALSPDAKWVVTAAAHRRGRLTIRDAVAGADVSPGGRHSDEVRHIAFGSGGNVATVSHQEAFVWDAVGHLLHELRAGGRLIEPTFAISPDGTRAACRVARESGAPPVPPLIVWNLAAGTSRTYTYTCDSHYPWAIRWEGNDVLRIEESKGQYIRLQLADGRQEATGPPPDAVPDFQDEVDPRADGDVWEVAVVGGRTLLAASISSGHVGEGEYGLIVWDVAAGGIVWESPRLRLPATAAAFSPDGRTLASGSRDGTALLWDLTPAAPAPAR